jgi:uncharacterized cupredoxin-like copper-binding protein
MDLGRTATSVGVMGYRRYGLATLFVIMLGMVLILTAAQIEPHTTEVSLTEFSIDMPTSLTAGPQTFSVTNNGTTEHNFEIEGQGIESVFDTNLVPGETLTMEVDLQPGTYEVYCPVGNHREQGMETELTVTE